MRNMMVSFLLVILLPVMAWADDDRFKQGTWELAIGLGSAGVSPFVGYFLADNVEGILHFNYIHNDSSSGGFTQKSDSVGVGGAAHYNLQTGTMAVPFFGPDVSYRYFTTSGFRSDSISVTGDLGVRLLVGKQASVDLTGSGGYEWFSSSGSGLGSHATEWTAGVMLAYSIFFFGP